MFEVQRLGMVAYQPTWDEQKNIVRSVDEGKIADQLLLLEHPHTVTMGRGSHLSNLLLSTQDYKAKGINVVEIDRGGDVTYHGPGQLVGYPIFYLGDQKHDAHSYLRDIEEALILALSSFGISGERMEKHTGVWVNEEKVAAIGVKFHKARNKKGYITSHGFALNVNTDLRYFSTIVPCGILEYGVTSMSRILGKKVDMDMVMNEVEMAMREIFT
ncbi:lipoyl(octanoyl) transferase LipB [Shimazuella sp. AN120528]|uniref:lipoyl(octanoyl) transferase LipB n=1 Tax=Shimazuella soli TaxID=1892854 RepID=UPI001F0EEB03|nr:lipoyl(octanoyl) transferase LipB [Shimazuella soli]MCH5584223.1 lipoyl(octanoyl) transferase LipB [Shimazuella soli]